MNKETTHKWGGVRPGAGRKKTASDPLVTISIRVTLPEKEEFRRLISEQGLTGQDFIKKAIAALK